MREQTESPPDAETPPTDELPPLPDPDPKPKPPAKRVYGTLGTVAIKNGPLEYAAGIRTNEFVISWRDYEPDVQGTFAPKYIQDRQKELQAYLAAGIRPTLSFSHHYTPLWVCKLPGAKFVNPAGDTYCGKPHNMVFSQTVRNAMIRAIEHIKADFGVDSFSAVRVMTAGVAGEVSYPKGGTYWAYDENASGGTDRPSTIPVRPYGNWKPGDTGLTAAQVRFWLDWYIGALADAVDFQVRAYQALGFKAPFLVISPGIGARPRAVDREIAANLGGGNALVAQGVAWYHFYGQLKTRASITAYTSSLGEGAKGQDCLSTDAAALPLSATVDAFDVGRYMAWIAKQYGMPAAGENPGCCGTSYNLSMMEAAARVANSCHFSHLYWAHTDQLHQGANGVTLADYQRLINTYGGP